MQSDTNVLSISRAQSTINGFCDFISQTILVCTTYQVSRSFHSSISSKVYRCWIVWGQDIRVVIIPSVLAFAFLGPSTYLHSLSNSNALPIATWLACVSSEYISRGYIRETLWGVYVSLASLSMSIIVNALVTGLIVFRIFKVFQEVKATSDDQTLGFTHGSKLRSIILIIIESGMALLSIQLARLIITILGLETNDSGYEDAVQLIICIHQQLNVIIRLVTLHCALLIAWLC